MHVRAFTGISVSKRSNTRRLHCIKCTSRLFSFLLLLHVFYAISMQWIRRSMTSAFRGMENDFADSSLTFVIPTQGRQSLFHALDSLLSQSVNEWKALVVFHSSISMLETYALPPHAEEFLLYIRDARVQFMTYTGVSQSNCAGAVRNFALQFVSTNWVAFLDDDDTVSHDYVLFFQKEIWLNPNVELVSFRMFDSRITDPNNLLKVLPEEQAIDAQRDHIGISFAFRQTQLNSVLFLKSATEDYLFIHNFCYASGRLCILSPYITYYVKGKQPENRVSAGNRTILRALPSELHFGHVVESVVACYAPHEQDFVPGRRVFSGESGTLEGRASSPLGLSLKLHDRAKRCSWKHEGVKGVHISLEFTKLQLKTKDNTIFVVHSGSQIKEVLRLPNQSFLWTTSTELKMNIISAGFDAARIQVINPWNILDMNDFGPCGLRDALSVSSVQHGETLQPSVSVFDTRADNVSGLFSRTCAQIQLAGFQATCLVDFDYDTILHACSADIVIFLFHDTIPEWVLVEYLILREKIVMFNSDRDELMNSFFSNFAFSFDSPSIALSTVVTISQNWQFFYDASRRAATALRKVIDESHQEEVCLALNAYAVVRARGTIT